MTKERRRPWHLVAVVGIMTLALLAPLPTGAQGHEHRENVPPDPGVVAEFDALQAYVEAAPGLTRGERSSLRVKLDAAERKYVEGRPCEAGDGIRPYLHETDAMARTNRAIGAELHRRGFLLRHHLLGALPSGMACGVGIPWLVDRSVQPDRASLPGDGPRPVGRMVDSRGNAMDFVTNEIVVTGTLADAEALAARWGGAVLRHGEMANGFRISLVRVDTQLGETGSLQANLEDMNGGDEGPQTSLLFSDEQAARLLNIAVRERLDGADAGVNPLGAQASPGSVLDGRTEEASTGPVGFGLDLTAYHRDSSTWNHLRPRVDVNDHDSQRTNVTEAWRLLEQAGRTTGRPSVSLTIHDDGFASQLFDDTEFLLAEDVDEENEVGCGDGNPCRWHGTNVASAAAATVDDGSGGAGPAGILDHPKIVGLGQTWAGDFFDTAWDLLPVNGPDIFNMSYGGTWPTVAAVVLLPLEGALGAASDGGITLIAAAGNDSENVDAEDCFFGCWEEATTFPCESAGVICVGALARSSRLKASFSNWGDDVDIWAPGVLLVGPDPDNPGDITQVFDGTSAAAPFVSGVAALMMAANPALRDDEDALRDALYRSASRGGSMTPRIVDAGASVRAVLPPLINIQSPNEGRRISRGTSISFSAFLWDAGTSSPTVEWVSDRDGRIGTGTFFGRHDLSFGDHVVTATARFPDGTVARDTVQFTVGNDAPVMRITHPGDPTSVFTGEELILEARSFDSNNVESGRRLQDAQVSWFLDGTRLPVTGHRVRWTFDLSTGPHTLTVRGTDGELIGEHSIRLEGAGTTSNHRPRVEIVAPAEGDSFVADQYDSSRDQYYAEVTFRGEAIDPEDGPLGAGDDLSWSIARSDGTIAHSGAGETEIVARLYAVGNGTTSYEARFAATDSGGRSNVYTVTVSVYVLI